MTVHVRWPARPAEHRAGLDFFATFCISEGVPGTRQKVDKLFKNKFCFIYFLLLVQKKVTKKSTAPMMYGHWRRLDLASVLLLTELNNSIHRHIPKLLKTQILLSD